MSPSRQRIFVLLGAYEDLTERESRALRRGDIDYVLSIQERKARLTDSLRETRPAVELLEGDAASFRQRLLALQAVEQGNLAELRQQMAQAQQELAEIGQVAQRSRQIRRGYSGLRGDLQSGSSVVLGTA